MTTAQNNDQRKAEADQRAAARDAFKARIRTLAEEYMAASPLSVSPEVQRQHIDRVIMAFRTLAAKDPNFYSCDVVSLARALALTVMSGLSPFGAQPECDIIIRAKRGKVGGQWKDVGHEASWQIGWRGYLALARRAGQTVKAMPVFEGEHFVWEEGLHARLEHKPTAQGLDFDKLVCCYVVVVSEHGRDFRVCPRAVIEDRRNRSDGWKSFQADKIKSTPWSTDPVAMAMKTAVRYAAQRGTLILDEVGNHVLQADYEDGDERVDPIDVPAEPVPERRALPDNSGWEALDEALEKADEKAVERVEREPGQDG